MSTVRPVRREVLVDAGPAVAFEVFTADIGRWWPLPDAEGEGMTVLRLPGRDQLSTRPGSRRKTTSASRSASSPSPSARGRS